MKALKKVAVAGLMGAFLAGISVGGAAEPQTSCGQPGAPPCPLQRWMREKVAAARYQKDLQKLAGHLDALAEWNPEPKQWSKWTRYAREGAAAARAGRRADGVCRGCHHDYRKRFKAKYRSRSAP